MKKNKNKKSVLSGKQKGLTGFLSPDSSSSDDDEYDYAAAEADPPGSAALPISAAQLPISAAQLPISAAQLPISAAQPSSAAPGFSSPVSAAQYDFMSPSSAASFNSPGMMSPEFPFSPAFNPGSPVLQRMSQNPNVCAHGVYRNGSCQVCNDRQQTLTNSTNPPTGVIPTSARMFEPPVPYSAGLSFSPLEASLITPVRRNLYETESFDSESEMTGGRKKYRKSKRKVRKSSRKSKRKVRKSSRKSKKSTKR